MACFAVGKLYQAVLVALMMMLASGGGGGGGVVRVRGDFAADRAECADKLMGLATCLTYVQATAAARSPTPDCCAGLKQVVAASKKCLCVLVKDRDEPALGLKINVTRAMDLPAVCNFPATFSDCPKILNMSPDSPDAEIFKEYARKHESKNGTAVPAAEAGSAGGKIASTAPTGGVGAGRQPCTVVFFLVSALLAAQHGRGADRSSGSPNRPIKLVLLDQFGPGAGPMVQFPTIHRGSVDRTVPRPQPARDRSHSAAFASPARARSSEESFAVPPQLALYAAVASSFLLLALLFPVQLLSMESMPMLTAGSSRAKETN